MKFLTKLLSFIKKERVIISIVLLVAAVSHGFNMFHFPYLENDEGAYISQTWSLLTQGQLAPYTYWYDHAPGGWFFIALWVFLTGGFFTFGLSVFSGRVFMLVLHVAMSYFLVLMGKRLTGRVWPGVIAVLIFSLSPLGIYFQRRVLLDNIMTFWVLASMVLLMRKNLSIRYVAMSALAFAFGVLSKENAVFFLPGLLYLLFTTAKKSNRKFAMIIWNFLAGSVISLYFLYAFLKSEFLPSGVMDHAHEHVSLITTLNMQLARGEGLPFWNPQSDFAISYMHWMSKDPVFILLAVGVTFASIVLAIRHKPIRMVLLFVLFFWFFLLRGKLIIEFYIVPLIPLIALLVGLVLDVFTKQLADIPFLLRHKIKIYALLMLLLACIISYGHLSLTTDQYTKDETTPEIKTIDWVKKNVPSNSNIIIDDYAYVDFHASRFAGDPVFPNADWFWKFSADPDIEYKKYNGNWDTIQYITLSHEMLKQIRVGSQPGLKVALDHANQVVLWNENTSSYLNIPQNISTNGDWMGIYKVKNKTAVTIADSWTFYKNTFLHSYGQIIDPSTKKTTSEGQSYGMLRAAFIGDRPTFEGIYSWTKDHLQFRTGDKLFSWLWETKNGKEHIGDSSTATDADEDIALALLIAADKWHEPMYKADAKQIVQDIWKREVVKVDDRYYLTMGDGSARPNGYILNPSYFSPASYRLFAQIDPTHPWNKLADDSYETLNELSQQSLTHLPTNWIFLNKTTGMLQSAKQYMDSDSDKYGFDAFRTYFRVALDNAWFPNDNAQQYLKESYGFFKNDWDKKHKVYSLYQTTGANTVDYDSLSTNTAPLIVFNSVDKSVASTFYKDKYLSLYHSDGYWGDPKNYFDQNWAWFGTALYTNNLPKPTVATN